MDGKTYEVHTHSLAVARLTSTNPAKGYEVLGEIEESTQAEVQQAVKDAKIEAKVWAQTSLSKRKVLVSAIVEAFRSKQKEFAESITQETGKSIHESTEEVADTIKWCEFMLSEADDMLADEILFEDENTKDVLHLEPWGVAGIILPWNYPFEMFVWGVIPHLLAGNVVVVKHSEECVLSGKLFADTVLSVDGSESCFFPVHGGRDVGKWLVSQDIDFLWFTGSSRTGQKLFEIAGQKFIPSVMELGGSSPGIVFDSVDVDGYLENMFVRRFTHCGQVCSSIKRLLVHESLYDSVVAGLQQRIDVIVIGDPMSDETDHGSLVAKRQLDLLIEQLADAREKGATIYEGKVSSDVTGAFHPFCLITDVSKDMRVWKEEVFGPALVVVPFSSEKEAVELANDTEYGLTAYVYTEDDDQFERVAKQVEAGRVARNDCGTSRCSPFGGYKKSGMGREHSRYGYAQICQLKTVTYRK